MAIESNLLGARGPLLRGGSRLQHHPSLIASSYVANEFQAPPSTPLGSGRQGGEIRAGLNPTSRWGRILGLGDTTPGSGREGGSPLCSRRDQITRFSAIFDLRAVTSVAIVARIRLRVFRNFGLSIPCIYSERFSVR